jgi:hypothetical protein
MGDLLKVESIKYLTCHSNTPAQVLDIVRSQEQIHWYWGLRQAELHIEYIRPSLEYIAKETKKLPATKKIKLEQLKTLKLLNLIAKFVPILGSWIEYKIQSVELEISAIEDPEQIQRMNQRISDAQAELDVAVSERNRILAEHPEILQMNYQELQAISVEALLEKKAFLVTSSQLGVHYGLSESASTVLAELGQKDLAKVLGIEYGRLMRINAILQPQRIVDSLDGSSTDFQTIPNNYNQQKY